MLKRSMYNNFIMKRNDGSCLYYNSATGALAWLEKETSECLENGLIDQLKQKDYFSQLINNGFVVEEYVDEYERYMFRSRQFILSQQNDVASYIIALTMNCNLRCLYCFEEGRYNHVPINDRTIDDIYNFITNSVVSSKKKKLNINWFGGEPLLALNQIVALSTRLIEFCECNDVSYTSSIVTNGTMLDREKLQTLKDKCSVKHIQISIDGDKEEYILLKRANEQNFDKVYDNLLLIPTLGIGLSVRLNVCKENANSLLHFVDKLVSEPNFHALIYVGKVISYNNSDVFHEISDEELIKFETKINAKISKYAEYKQLIKKNLKPKGASCGYLVHDRCLIDPNGRLYRCEHHINNPDFAIGDVINGFYHNEIDNKFLFQSLPQKCHQCSIMPVCMGGCASDRLLYDKWISCDYMHQKINLLCKDLFFK